MSLILYCESHDVLYVLVNYVISLMISLPPSLPLPLPHSLPPSLSLSFLSLLQMDDCRGDSVQLPHSICTRQCVSYGHTHTHTALREREREIQIQIDYGKEREREGQDVLQLIFQLLPTLVLYTLTLIDFPLSS